jgi:anaphase-promoting complex subunit 3
MDFSTPKTSINTDADASRWPTNDHLQNTLIHQLFRHFVNEFLHNSSFTDALFMAERWAAWFPRDDEARVAWAKCLLHNDQNRACLDVLKSSVKSPWDRMSLYLQAQACLALGMETRGQAVMDRLLREMEDGMDSLQLSDVGANVDLASLRLLRAKFLKSDQDTGRRLDDLTVALDSNPFSWDAFAQLCDLGKEFDTDHLYTLARCLRNVESTGFIDKLDKNIGENREPRVALSPKNKLATVNSNRFYGIQPLPSNEMSAAPKATKLVKIKPNVPLTKTEKPKTLAPRTEKKRDRIGKPVKADEDKKVDKRKPLVELALQTILAMLRRMAKGYYHLSRFECKEAISELSNLPSAQLNSGVVLEWMGRAHFERAEYEKAHEVFESLRRREPWRVSGTDIHSVTLWHMRRPMELSHLAQHLIEIAPNSFQRWIVAGNCFSLHQEHENAIGCFEKALKADAHCAYAHTLIGHEHVLNEDLDQALKSFQAAFLQDSRHYNAWYGMGSIFYRQEKFDEALAHFEEALTINQSNPILICYKGMVLLKKNRLHEALECFRCAERVAPDNPLVAFRKAQVLAVMQDYSEALKVLERLKEKTQECDVYYLLGVVHKKLGDHRQAMLNFTLAQDARTKDGALLKESIGTSFKKEWANFHR